MNTNKIYLWIFLSFVLCVFFIVGAVVGYTLGEAPGCYIGIGVSLILFRAWLVLLPVILDVFRRFTLGNKDKSKGVIGRDDVAEAYPIKVLHNEGSRHNKWRFWLKLIVAIVVIAVIGSVTALHHDLTYNEISSACWSAKTASTLKLRQAFLQEGYKASQKFGLFIPNKTWSGSNSIERCDEVQTELAEMLIRGDCTKYILNDVPCKCGLMVWSPDNPVEDCTHFNNRNPRCLPDAETGKYEITCSGW